MALARAVTDGFRKLTIEATVLSGAAPDLQSLAIRPILKPYTVQAILRVTDASGAVVDYTIQWQATPRFNDLEGQGAAIGSQAQQAG